MAQGATLPPGLTHKPPPPPPGRSSGAHASQGWPPGSSPHEVHLPQRKLDVAAKPQSAASWDADVYTQSRTDAALSRQARFTAAATNEGPFARDGAQFPTDGVLPQGRRGAAEVAAKPAAAQADWLATDYQANLEASAQSKAERFRAACEAPAPYGHDPAASAGPEYPSDYVRVAHKEACNDKVGSTKWQLWQHNK